MMKGMIEVEQQAAMMELMLAAWMGDSKVDERVNGWVGLTVSEKVGQKAGKWAGVMVVSMAVQQEILSAEKQADSLVS